MKDSSKYVQYPIHVAHTRYTKAMHSWAYALDDTHWVYYASGVMIYFKCIEDLTAFKIAFNV